MVLNLSNIKVLAFSCMHHFVDLHLQIMDSVLKVRVGLACAHLVSSHSLHVG